MLSLLSAEASKISTFTQQFENVCSFFRIMLTVLFWSRATKFHLLLITSASCTPANFTVSYSSMNFVSKFFVEEHALTPSPRPLVNNIYHHIENRASTFPCIFLKHCPQPWKRFSMNPNRSPNNFFINIFYTRGCSFGSATIWHLSRHSGHKFLVSVILCAFHQSNPL